MAHLKLISAFCLTFAVAASAGAADYWVWVDENGVTNYAEQSPKGVNARHITDSTPFGPEGNAMDSRRPGRTGEESSANGEAPTESTPSPAPVSSSADQNVDPDQLAAQDRKKFEEQIAETKKKNCEMGKKNLAQLQTYARIRVKGDDGKERVLSPEEKQKKIEEARQIIRDNCSG